MLNFHSPFEREIAAILEEKPRGFKIFSSQRVPLTCPPIYKCCMPAKDLKFSKKFGARSDLKFF